MSIKGRSFHFRFWSTLLTVLFVPILLLLGTWQVHRLQWKENLIETVEKRTHQEPVDAAALLTGEDLNYRRAKVSGIFHDEQSFYLLSISQTGQGGYHLLTPMTLSNGSSLLVDRGWIPYDVKNNLKSRVGYAAPQGLTSVEGILRIPQHSFLQPSNRLKENSWFYTDLKAMASLAGIKAFLPYVLEAAAGSSPGPGPVGGQTLLTFPNNHFIYAVTWYALALALILIYFLSAYRQDDED